MTPMRCCISQLAWFALLVGACGAVPNTAFGMCQSKPDLDLYLDYSVPGIGPNAAAVERSAFFAVPRSKAKPCRDTRHFFLELSFDPIFDVIPLRADLEDAIWFPSEATDQPSFVLHCKTRGGWCTKFPTKAPR